MGPTSSEVHVNRPLSNVMTVYTQEEGAFVCNQVFPTVPVQKRSDLWFSIPKDAWFRGSATLRAPGTETAGITYDVNPNNVYFCRDYGVHTDLSDQVRANFDSPLAADQASMRLVARSLLVTRELQFMQTYMQPNIWSGMNAPSTPAGTNVDYNVGAGRTAGGGYGFWDTANSDPIKDIRLAQTTVQSKTGYIPKTLTLTKDVFDAVCNNPVVLDRIKYTQRGVITQDLLASLFQVDKLLVAQAVLNSSQEGRLANMGFMVSNCWLLTYAPPSPSITDASAGYIFSWNGFLGGGALTAVMKTYRMEHLESDRYEGQMAYDMKQVATDLGVYGTNVLQTP